MQDSGLNLKRSLAIARGAPGHTVGCDTFGAKTV